MHRSIEWSLIAGSIVLATSVLAQNPPCTAVNNGGTVVLPPLDCGYLSESEVHMIANGFPVGTTIVLTLAHESFNPVTPMPPPGGVFGPGGEIEQFSSLLVMQLDGTGTLQGFHRDITILVDCEVHTAPRTAGDPVQDFDNDMQLLQGDLPFGDPDFDLLRIRAGTAMGLPSPGHTTLTRTGVGDFVVDSFFDITYEIEFIGAPGGALAGFSGTTQGQLRMEAAGPPCFNCSQSDDPGHIVPGSIACQGATVNENSYWRVYDLAADCGIGGDALVKCVRFGNEIAVSGGSGSQPVNVRVYALSVAPVGGTFDLGDLTLLDEVELDFADGNSGTFTEVPVCARVPAGTLCAVEINTPDATSTNDRFFMGSNPAGQSGASYLSAPACALLNPTDLATITFPDVHHLLHIETQPLIGTSFCPNNANTSGQPAEIFAAGSNSVSTNDLTLLAVQLPPNNFGYFLASDGMIPVDLVTPGLSQGNFCIQSANPSNVGRYDDAVQFSGATGTICLNISLPSVPIAGPGPFHSIVFSETWYFQAWYRDFLSPLPNNNFSNAVGVFFTF